jgi:hypothetical protein
LEEPSETIGGSQYTAGSSENISKCQDFAESFFQKTITKENKEFQEILIMLNFHLRKLLLAWCGVCGHDELVVWLPD